MLDQINTKLNFCVKESEVATENETKLLVQRVVFVTLALVYIDLEHTMDSAISAEPAGGFIAFYLLRQLQLSHFL